MKAQNRNTATRGVFFDLDGTLADTVGALTATLNDVFSRHGYPMLTHSDTLRCINYGARELVRRAAPESCAPEEIDSLLSEYLACLCLHNLETREAYEGICVLLDRLDAEGYALAVLTNKPHTMAHELVGALFGDRFAFVLGQTAKYKNKPDPEMAQAALDALGLLPDEVVFIGDSRVDVEFARNSGMRFVGAGWGFFGKDKLVESGARDVADHPLEILEYLK